jgi:hypothetical protein
VAVSNKKFGENSGRWAVGRVQGSEFRVQESGVRDRESGGGWKRVLAKAQRRRVGAKRKSRKEGTLIGADLR